MSNKRLLNTILKIVITTNGGGRGWGQHQVQDSNIPGGVDSVVCKRISIVHSFVSFEFISLMVCLCIQKEPICDMVMLLKWLLWVGMIQQY